MREISSNELKPPSPDTQVLTMTEGGVNSPLYVSVRSAVKPLIPFNPAFCSQSVDFYHPNAALWDDVFHICKQTAYSDQEMTWPTDVADTFNWGP